MSAIEIDKISKSFVTKDGTVEALKNVSLSIEEGDIYGVIGMSGAGKSTLVRCMNFLERPDEATSALDPRTTSSILALLKDINQRFGITIVIITHQMSVVREICSHVAIMQNGEVAETGEVAEVFAHPKSKVARELIVKEIDSDTEGQIPTTEEKIQEGEIIRIVFSENSAFEPVIANMILTFGEPVNILKASTKNVGGIAKGEIK